MRIVAVHNFYRSDQPSGENSVVREEVELLRSAGQEVWLWSTSSDRLLTGSLPIRVGKQLINALGPIYHQDGGREFGKYLDAVRPDVVHIHNVYPLISPSVIETAKRRGIPVVHTVHNYRRECVKGTFYRNGDLCMLCDGRRLPHPAIAHGCYGNSRLRSIPMAASKLLNYDLWREIDVNIVLTDYQRSWLESNGISREKIVVRPTSCDPPPSRRPVKTKRQFCFVGRLDTEKGVDLLLQAWTQSGIGRRGWRLVIVGDGPLLEQVEKFANGLDSVSYLGRASRSEVGDLIRESLATLVPSRWLEGFPRVVVETFAEGRPVVALRNPNMESIVGECGWMVDDAARFAGALTYLSDHIELLEELGLKAKARYNRELQAGRSLRQLVEIYQGLM